MDRNFFLTCSTPAVCAAETPIYGPAWTAFVGGADGMASFTVFASAPLTAEPL